MAKLVQISMTFDITNDDKEHQDYVAAEFRPSTGGTTGTVVICEASNSNGNAGDANAFYWPSSGPGKHSHQYQLDVSRLNVAPGAIPGSLLIISSNSGTGDDFESWHSTMTVVAIDDAGVQYALGTHTIDFNGAGQNTVRL